MFGMGGQAKPQAQAPKAPKAPTARKKLQQASVTVQLHPALKDKFELLGGEAWLREQIEQAEVPSPFGG